MKIATILLLIIGCSCETKRVGNDSEPDSFVVFEASLCNDRQLLSDFFNCGTCGHSCNSSNTNTCTLGICKCGTYDSCIDGSDCREGRCVESDALGQICEFDQECNIGFYCIESHCSFGFCTEEVCDGADNDCDSEVDEGSPGTPLSRWCYSGEGESWRNEPCRRGVEYCSLGSWSECRDEIGPTLEVGLHACDGIDNNCDGCVDGFRTINGCEPAINTGYDVLFVVDISGSMNSTITTVRNAVQRFSATYSSDPSFKFGIVVFPVNETMGGSAVLQDLSDFATFLNALSMLPMANNSYEGNWDAVQQASTGDLILSWRAETTKIIILFTDENGQSYLSPRISEQEMCDSMQNGEVFVTITKTVDSDDFDNCGTNYNINSTEEEIVENLRNSLGDPCR